MNDAVLKYPSVAPFVIMEQLTPLPEVTTQLLYDELWPQYYLEDDVKIGPLDEALCRDRQRRVALWVLGQTNATVRAAIDAAPVKLRGRFSNASPPPFADMLEYYLANDNLDAFIELHFNGTTYSKWQTEHRALTLADVTDRFMYMQSGDFTGDAHIALVKRTYMSKQVEKLALAAGHSISLRFGQSAWNLVSIFYAFAVQANVQPSLNFDIVRMMPTEPVHVHRGLNRFHLLGRYRGKYWADLYLQSDSVHVYDFEFVIDDVVANDDVAFFEWGPTLFEGGMAQYFAKNNKTPGNVKSGLIELYCQRLPFTGNPNRLFDYLNLMASLSADTLPAFRQREAMFARVVAACTSRDAWRYFCWAVSRNPPTPDTVAIVAKWLAAAGFRTVEAFVPWAYMWCSPSLFANYIPTSGIDYDSILTDYAILAPNTVQSTKPHTVTFRDLKQTFARTKHVRSGPFLFPNPGIRATGGSVTEWKALLAECPYPVLWIRILPRSTALDILATELVRAHILTNDDLTPKTVVTHILQPMFERFPGRLRALIRINKRVAERLIELVDIDTIAKMDARLCLFIIRQMEDREDLRATLLDWTQLTYNTLAARYTETRSSGLRAVIVALENHFLSFRNE